MRGRLVAGRRLGGVGRKYGVRQRVADRRRLAVEHDDRRPQGDRARVPLPRRLDGARPSRALPRHLQHRRPHRLQRRHPRRAPRRPRTGLQGRPACAGAADAGARGHAPDPRGRMAAGAVPEVGARRRRALLLRRLHQCRPRTRGRTTPRSTRSCSTVRGKPRRASPGGLGVLQSTSRDAGRTAAAWRSRAILRHDRYVPILEVLGNDPKQRLGAGYIEAWESARGPSAEPPACASCSRMAARPAEITGAWLRVKRLGESSAPLQLSLETSTGSPLASSQASAQGISNESLEPVHVRFPRPARLASGARVALRAASPAPSAYTTFPIRKGATSGSTRRRLRSRLRPVHGRRRLDRLGAVGCPRPSRRRPAIRARRPVTVCHVTVAHDAWDARIFHKECATLAAAGYRVARVAPHGRREIRTASRSSRCARRAAGWIACWACRRARAVAAARQRAALYHVHDPELIPLALLAARALAQAGRLRHARAALGGHRRAARPPPAAGPERAAAGPRALAAARLRPRRLRDGGPPARDARAARRRHAAQPADRRGGRARGWSAPLGPAPLRRHPPRLDLGAPAEVHARGRTASSWTRARSSHGSSSGSNRRPSNGPGPATMVALPGAPRRLPRAGAASGGPRPRAVLARRVPPITR